jgi:tRNA(fMet)-specific endonuclease VapC
MPTHLLDTNILSDLIRNPAGTAARHLGEHGEGDVCTSIVVACELRFGAAKRGSSVLSDRVEQLLSRLPVLALAPGVDRRYARLRAHLETAGTPIGPNDLLIAAHALEHGLVIVTGNVREFRRVPELTVENWLDQGRP